MFDVIKDDLAQLEEELLAIAQTPTMLITEIGTHLVKAGGKRLRPALYFLAAHSREEEVEHLQSLAIALELIHMATLVHDDVIDEASTRRGIPTANVKWGNQMAVLAGDYMF
ncbi:MAG: polyprenyl synthetase family protein, partial [Christensenellaceae bacterium]|nr:polyprenyl synthetase family protein [Christensenellaceae bacterium]